MTPPIRFLALVLGGWTIARTIALMADAEPVAQRLVPTAAASTVKQIDVPSVRSPPTSVPAEIAALPSLQSASSRESVVAGIHPVRLYAAAPGPQTPPVDAELPSPALVNDFASRAIAALQPSVASVAPLTPTPAQPSSRWSGSAWLLARAGNEAVIANNGLLGGSQAGARVLFRVNDDVARPLSLGVRVSSPLRRSGVEAAAGVEWQPFADVPVRVLAERRQRLSGEGRSAFALLAHGGVSDLPVASGFRLEAYAQAGVVGARSRDLFADAGATLVRPLSADHPAGLAVGAGVWGGAQPGASRLDVGPRVTTTLAGGRARVSLDWRFRVAGDSAPSSGPSLTLGTGF